eukprot:scaffold3.g6161.t1
MAPKGKGKAAAKDDASGTSTSYIQVLGIGTDTGTAVPSALLFFDRQRYLFNAGEGFQRFCVEHKLKMSKLSAVLLTRTSTEASGGLPGAAPQQWAAALAQGRGRVPSLRLPSYKRLHLPVTTRLPPAAACAGMLLTMSDYSCGGLLSGHTGMRVMGPRGLNALVNAFRTFINVRNMGLSVEEFGPHRVAAAAATQHQQQQEQEAVANKAAVPGGVVAEAGEGEAKAAAAGGVLPPVVANELVIITPVVVEAPPPEGGAGDIEPQAKRPRLGQGELDISTVAVESPAACYVCELPEIPGKFLPQKAASLGVPRGPLYGKLVKGEEVTAANGRIVKPSDVMEPSIPGPVVLVVDCPTDAFLPCLASAPLLQQCTSGDKRDRVAAVVHLSPREVLQLPEYKQWLGTFRPEASHILVAESIASGVPIQRRAAALQAKLNVIDAGLFSLHSTLGEEEAAAAPLPEGCTAGRNMLRYHLRPVGKQGIDTEECPGLLDEAKVQQELRESKPEVVAAAEAAAQGQESGPAAPECVATADREEFEVTFLGTGASVPSKYRNVTGVYVNLFGKGGLLMDCGEGSYGQLRRRFGAAGADALIARLSCIWVSHIHADHHVGLPAILAARTRLLGPDCPPLLVFGPRPLRRALMAYALLEPMRFQFVEASAMAAPELVPPGAPAVPEGVQARIEAMREGMGLSRFESVPVAHCAHAYALVLESAAKGWKLVFSGDTRPCEQLVQAAKGATLLIHEATFDDSMEAEAKAKKHSTTADAVTTGARAGAYRTLLTHFSQRYPKIPVVDESFQGHYYQDAVGIAFDLMTVNLADLPHLPRLVPALKLLFAEEDDEPEPMPHMLT